VKATLSVDHRVSDGAEGAQFMQKLGEFLENPVRMLV
jgi:pyruvate dehydrogenase E2 component (dihydrolipoamide acetyltransferase)